MSQLQDEIAPGPDVKTIAVRLNPDMHAQLAMIAQLTGNSVTHEIRQAIAQHIVAMKADPTVLARAENAIKDIEVEAAQRRQTIQSLFGEDGSTSAKGGRARTRKSAETPTKPA